MKEIQEFSKLTSIEKCPVCSRELEKGYVHANRGIYWDTKRHRIWAWSGEAVMSMWSWAVPYASALRCKNCKIIVFHYGKKRDES
jgi:hypothetical protein